MADYKAIYDKEEDIPEAVEDFRALFVERDGKFELKGIDGIHTQISIDKLDKSVRSARQDAIALKEKHSVWADLDHDDVMAKLDRITELEAAAGDKLDKAGIDDIVNKRVDGVLQSKMAPLQRDLTKLTKERDELASTNTQLGAAAIDRERRDLLDPMLAKAKVIPQHYTDVYMYAKEHLTRLDGDSGFFVKAGQASVTEGDSMQDWLDQMIENRPGWLPPSVGGDAKGSGRLGGGVGNPFARKTWDVERQSRISAEKGMDHVRALAKAAGTTVGSRENDPKANPRKA